MEILPAFLAKFACLKIELTRFLWVEIKKFEFNCFSFSWFLAEKLKKNEKKITPVVVQLFLGFELSVWRFSNSRFILPLFSIILHCTNKLSRNQHPSEFRTLCSHADNGQQTSGHERMDGQRTTVKFSHTDFPFFWHSRLSTSRHDKRGAKCDKKGISFTLEWDKMDLMSKVFVLFSSPSWGKEESFSVIVHHTCWRSSPRLLVSLVVWCCWGFSALESRREI